MAQADKVGSCGTTVRAVQCWAWGSSVSAWVRLLTASSGETKKLRFKDMDAEHQRFLVLDLW